MGFMDGFTSDGTVDMKHTEYYNLMREAAKAELIGNAVKADVPGFYIQAMITGKSRSFLTHWMWKRKARVFMQNMSRLPGQWLRFLKPG